MPKQYFCCEVCFTPFQTEDAARTCEQGHCPRDKMTLQATAWERNITLGDSWAPTKVIIRMPVQYFNEEEGRTQEVTYVREL